MTRYDVKGTGSTQTFVDVMRERNDGFEVLITCSCDNHQKTVREFIERPLFDTCVRTGYLTRRRPDAGLQ